VAAPGAVYTETTDGGENLGTTYKKDSGGKGTPVGKTAVAISYSIQISYMLFEMTVQRYTVRDLEKHGLYKLGNHDIG